MELVQGSKLIFLFQKKQNNPKSIKSFGAKIHLVHGSRGKVSRATSSRECYFAGHVLNPEFRDGMRQISYEIFRRSNFKIPKRVIVPVSAGTILLGMISGFEHFLESDIATI